MNLLDELYSRHETVHLMYSGGKDSSACAGLIAEAGYGPRTVLVSVDTGAILPEIKQQFEVLRPNFKDVVWLQSDQPSYIRENGWPTDLLVLNNTKLGKYFARKYTGMRVCNRYECCGALRWKVWAEWFQQNPEVTAIIKGERDSDDAGTLTAEMPFPNKTIEMCYPIRDWSTEQVLNYISKFKWFTDNRGQLLPRFLLSSSTCLDCWNCTAFWDSAPERLEYLKKFHPERGAVYEKLLKNVKQDAVECLELLKDLGDKDE